MSIAENISIVRKRIADAAVKAGRDPSSITLVAVSKTKPTALVEEAYAAGQRVFGENYAQEFRDKTAELSELDIEWHFIGHLQKNKAKYITPSATMMESIDSKELADTLDGRADRTIDCLIEVNIGEEESKAGVTRDEILPLTEHINNLKHLKLRGLMVIPPFDLDPEEVRPYFKGLREELEKLNGWLKLSEPLTELSMGMTGDFEVAISEGATIVRVGTAIFGSRY
jgi:PLP dependent protein